MVELMESPVSYLALRTADLDSSLRYWQQIFGMVRHPDGPEGAVRLGWGIGHHVLELRQGTPGLDRVGIEVRDQGGPDALAKRLAACGISVTKADRAQEFYARDPDDNLLHLHGYIDRSGELTGHSRARAVRLQHVTFGSPDPEAMVEFYTQLGLTLSDRMESHFFWLRSASEHHSIAVVRAPVASLDHYCFDLAEWDDFKFWADRLTQLGISITWGPGRHGPGNNIFLFVDDPDGLHVELSAEMEIFWNRQMRAEPRVWKAEPGTINLWGGQLATWRSAEGR